MGSRNLLTKRNIRKVLVAIRECNKKKFSPGYTQLSRLTGLSVYTSKRIKDYCKREGYIGRNGFVNYKGLDLVERHVETEFPIYTERVAIGSALRDALSYVCGKGRAIHILQKHSGIDTADVQHLLNGGILGNDRDEYLGNIRAVVRSLEDIAPDRGIDKKTFMCLHVSDMGDVYEIIN